MKKALSIVLSIFLILPSQAWAVTAFNVSVMPSGGDYSRLEYFFDSTRAIDLTAASTKVFSITGGITGTMTDNTACTGATSGATGTCVHASSISNQILIKSITGTFQSGEIVYETLGTNYVTLGDAGDSAKLLINISGDWSAIPDAVKLNFYNQRIGTSTSNDIEIFTSGLALNPTGVYSSSYYRLEASINGDTVIDTKGINNLSLTNIQVKNTYTGASTYSNAIRVGSYTGYTGIGQVYDRCIFISYGSDVSSAAVRDSLVTTYLIKNSVLIAEGGGNALYTAGGYSGTTQSLYNNVFISKGTAAAFVQTLVGTSYSIDARNNYAASGSGLAYSIGATTVTLSTNASYDTTGSTGLQNIAYSTANFTNVTSGSEDFSLPVGSALIGTGTDLSATFTDDITGATRTVPWDIGAFKYAGSATVNHGFTRFLN